MFPFTLNGPDFLLFYALFAAVLLIGLWRRASVAKETGAGTRLTSLTADPYKIAYLRGREEETLRIALTNLVDRGLLDHSGAVLTASAKAGADLVRRPLDQAILRRCASPMTTDALLKDAALRALCADYERQLQDAGLLRSEDAQRATQIGLLVVLGMLGGIALARIVQALSHGRSNVLFLIVLVLAAMVLAWKIYANRKTAAGRRMLGSLQKLMGRLKARAGSLARGGATNEAVLLAAVFGLYALPGTVFPFVPQLFPKPVASSSGSGSWDSAGSTGSSCSSDSGSSCGGGGGGGCGGCGGD